MNSSDFLIPFGLKLPGVFFVASDTDHLRMLTSSLSRLHAAKTRCGYVGDMFWDDVIVM